MVLRALPLALLTLLVLLPQGAAAETTARIIVQRDSGLSASERAGIRADVGGELVDILSVPRTEVIEVPRARLASALRELRNNSDVALAQRDRPVRAASNDPEFGKLWGLHNTGQPAYNFNGTSTYTGTGDADIDLPEAWTMSSGTGITVAVVDSGVKANHPDLSGRLLSGRDWVDGGAPEDEDGHGTHVTGTIVANRDNGLGIAGVAPRASVTPLRVLDENGFGWTSDVVDAFQVAGEQGIRVVNASLGFVGPDDLERQVIADHPNTLYVTAAGNAGEDNDDAEVAEYPCSYTLVNVLCVAATNANDAKPAFSNYGENSVDVFAPGLGILSTANTGGYAVMSGTSMATPHVAGIAALLLARNRSLSTTQLKSVIINTVDQRSSLTPISVSNGRVNARAALASVPANRDGDGLGDDSDACPDQAGPLAGCPDADHDGIPDSADNCPTVANSGQQNTDGRADGGDVCDRDRDNDGRPDTSDACPTVYAVTANGCLPPPPPNRDRDGRIDAIDACPTEYALTKDGCPLAALTGLSTKPRKRGVRRSVVVKASTSRAARVRILLQRKKGRKWVKVKRRTLASQRNRVQLTVKRLKRGRHRIVVAVYSNAGLGGSATRYFKVR
ncbi:MAG TPA: S8 family serine peptidase [Solirubrobacteraceae bacterium]|nr:S8 family serine peptidase [Solirubrobacteraceae bacterium]